MATTDSSSGSTEQHLSKYDVEYDSGPPVEDFGLEMQLLERQTIHDEVEITSGVLGIVLDGEDDYIESRNCVEFSISSTYSNWGEELETQTIHERRKDTEVVSGHVGVNKEDATKYLQLGYKSDFIRAAVRIVTGGGRYSTENIECYYGVPTAIVRHDNGRTMTVAPLFIRDEEEIKNEPPQFVYETDEDSRGINSLEVFNSDVLQF